LDGRLIHGSGFKGLTFFQEKIPQSEVRLVRDFVGEIFGFQEGAELLAGGALLALLGQGLGKNDLSPGNGGGVGVIFDQVVEVGGSGLGIPGFQGRGAQQEQGRGKAAAFVIVVFALADGVAQTKRGGGQGLGSLGGGEVFAGGGEVGFGIPPPIEGFLEGGGGVGGLATGTVDPADGDPGAGQKIAAGTVRFLE